MRPQSPCAAVLVCIISICASKSWAGKCEDILENRGPLQITYQLDDAARAAGISSCCLTRQITQNGFIFEIKNIVNGDVFGIQKGIPPFFIFSNENKKRSYTEYITYDIDINGDYISENRSFSFNAIEGRQGKESPHPIRTDVAFLGYEVMNIDGCEYKTIKINMEYTQNFNSNEIRYRSNNLYSADINSSLMLEFFSSDSISSVQKAIKIDRLIMEQK